MELYFLTVLAAGKSKVKVLASPVSREDSALSLQVATFSLCSRGQEGMSSGLFLFCKDTSSVRSGLHPSDLV